ncbi:MAG: putative toxin-antitoxin system toxin component, PIN family [Calditrichaceae bacterium]
MRVVFDTCVWIAAVRSRRGASYALLSEIPYKRFDFGISVPLFIEYKAELYKAVNSKATSLHKRQIDAILAAFVYYGKEVPVYYKLRPNLKDENDNMVFECAANFGASTIITHNIKDFMNPELHDYGIDILTPRDFLLTIRSKP